MSPVLAQQPSIAANSIAQGFGGGAARNYQHCIRTDSVDLLAFSWPDLELFNAHFAYWRLDAQLELRQREIRHSTNTFNMATRASHNKNNAGL